MIKLFADKSRELARNTRGNVAVMLALVLVPVCIVAGFAIDLSRVEGANKQVQSALDSAVLAAARILQDSGTDKQVQAEGKAFFNNSMSQNRVVANCGDPVLTVVRKNQKIEGSVTCVHPTSMSGIFGLTEMTITRKADTFFGIGKLDVVFMFDTSGSMGEENRMVDLKSAATEAVNTIFDADTSGQGYVRIGVSTYATSVNAGAELFETVTNEKPNQTVCTATRKGYSCTKVTTTCVTEREGSQKFTDAKPGAGAWINYATTSCNSAGLLPLTATKTKVTDIIKSLPTSGNTAGHLGIAWSWYIMSPNWSSIWPKESEPLAYDSAIGRKIAVLMTDGNFNTDYSSGGSSFTHASSFCDAMKAQGITIYSVAFKAPQQGQKVLADCASDADHSFAASNGEELTAAYATIAADISALRLTK